MNELAPFFDAAIEFTTKHGFATGLVIAVAITFAIAFQWSGRLYESYRSAGRERMGLYLSITIQSWLLFAMATSPIWLVSMIMQGTPLAPHLRDLHLTTPISLTEMLYWSVALLLATAAIAWIATAVQKALRTPPAKFRTLIQPVSAAEKATWLLLVAPTAGFCEEVVFRGVLLSFATQAADDLWIGIAVSSLLFGLLHFAQGAVGILTTCVMSVVMAAAVAYSGSLWPCIVAHALYDMAAPFVFRLDDAQSEPAQHA